MFSSFCIVFFDEILKCDHLNGAFKHYRHVALFAFEDGLFFRIFKLRIVFSRKFEFRVAFQGSLSHT